MMQRDRTEAEKETRAAERRLEFERRRAERLGSRVNGPRNGRPVRVEVDDGAWAVVQRDVVQHGRAMMWRVAELLEAELLTVGLCVVTGSPSSRRRRSPGEVASTARVRFLRIEVDAETWRTFRIAALDLGLTAARYLGEIVESEAHCLGWRAGSD